MSVNDFIGVVVSKRLAILIGFFLLTIPASYYALQQRHDNNLDVFFEKSDREWVKYKEFQDIYGNEEVLAIVVQHKNIFSQPVLEVIAKIGDAVQEIDGVHSVASITEAEGPVNEDGGETVGFSKFFPKGTLTPKEIEKGQERLADSRLIQNYLMSEDGSLTAIITVLEALVEKDKKRVVKEIYRRASSIAGSKVELRFAGIPAAETEMNRIGFRDVIVLGVATYLIVFIIIFVLVRNFTLSLLVHVNLLVTFVFSIGLYVFSGEKFNMVTTSMGVVLLSICVADAIHFLSQYRESYPGSGDDVVGAVKNAVGHVWVPCLFTSVTTGVGFLSFAAGTIRPARIYGIFTCIGVMIAFFLTMTLLPILVIYLRTIIHPEKNTDRSTSVFHTKDDFLSRAITGIGLVTIKHYRLIGVAGIVILFISTIGITKIRFETDMVKYFPKENQVKQDQAYIEKHLGGIVPVLLRVQSASPDVDFTHAAAVHFLDEIQSYILANADNFTATFSISDVFKEIHRAFNGGHDDFYRVPDSDADILDYYELSPGEEVDRLVRHDRREAVVTFMTVWQSLENASSVHHFIDTYMGEKAGDKFTYEMTGYRILMMSMGEKMKESQIRSLFVALVIVFFMMYFVCRSVSLTFFAMIPNVLPIVMIYGLMGWFGIAVDIVTLMVGSIVMGIAVDDTVHYIIWFRRNMAQEETMEAALLKSYRDVGKPIVITTIVLFLGFIIFIFGETVPTRFFGTLVAFSILFALLADFLVLPAVILIFKPKIKPIQPVQGTPVH